MQEAYGWHTLGSNGLINRLNIPAVIGETLTIDNDNPLSACKNGFHACQSPMDALKFNGPILCYVRLSGEIQECYLTLPLLRQPMMVASQRTVLAMMNVSRILEYFVYLSFFGSTLHDLLEDKINFELFANKNKTVSDIQDVIDDLYRDGRGIEYMITYKEPYRNNGDLLTHMMKSAFNVKALQSHHTSATL